MPIYTLAQIEEQVVTLRDTVQALSGIRHAIDTNTVGGATAFSAISDAIDSKEELLRRVLSLEFQLPFDIVTGDEEEGEDDAIGEDDAG